MRFTKGINRDVAPSAQPEGTYRNLTNGIVTDDQGTIQIEDGTEVVETLSGSIVGDIILSDNRLVLFISNGSTDEIRLFDGTSTSLVVTDDFQFDNVVGTHTVNDSGDTIIYWTDGVNPPRFINIDNPTYSTLNELNLFPEYNTEEVSFTLDKVLSSGGTLEAGSYYLTFAYIDEDNTLTDYFLVTDPISILSSTGYGADEDTPTSKAIKFSLDNLDTEYQSVRISSIKETQVTNVIDIGIPDSGSIDYVYTGNESDTAGSLDEVVINNPIYETANALEQHDNSLYLGGLTGKELTREQKEDLQEAAINSNITAITKNETDLRFYQNAENAYNNRSFKRGEVYAFYVSFLKEDGRETDAFHIPGRESLDGETIDSTATIDIISVDTPDDSYADAGFSFVGDIPQNTEKAYGGWRLNTNSDNTVDAHEIRIRFLDPSNNNLLTNFSPDYIQFSFSSGGADSQLDTLVSDINSRLTDENLDGDWEAIRDADGPNQFAIQAKNAGTSFNDYDVQLATNGDGTSGQDWTGVAAGNNSVDSDITSYASDPTDFGVDNDDYNSNVDLTITRNDGNDVDTIIINAKTDTDLNWGSESPWKEGDSEDVVLTKFVALMNDTSNQSHPTYGTEFTNIQNEYTFTDNGVDITIKADSFGEQYNGTLDLTDPANNVEVANPISIEDGYIQSDGALFTIVIDFNGPDVTVNYDYSPGDSLSDMASSLATDISNDSNLPSDVSVTSNGNKIELTEPDGDYVGNSISIGNDYNSFTYNTSTFSPIDTFEETSTISSGDFSGNKKYQIYGRPDPTYNMGYWENENENYPDTQPFIRTGLANNPVKHHKFSDNVYGEPFYDPITDSINITGVRLTNLSVPSGLEDDIVGYKLYYAKKDESNQLVLGQGSFNHGWLDRKSTSSDDTNNGYRGARPHQQNDAVFNEDILVTHGFDELADYKKLSTDSAPFLDAIEFGSHDEFGYSRPADILINDVDISGASFIKKTIFTTYDHREIDDFSFDSVIASNEISNYISPLKAKAKVDANQRNINLTNFNFSYDMDNLFGESKVVVELDDDSLCDRGQRVISDLCQTLTDVHTPFTNQRLVDTGYKGQFDSNGDQVSPNDDIYGGDIYIGENYYRANTLLALGEEAAWTGQKDDDTDQDESWWSRDHGSSDTTNVPNSDASYETGDSPFGRYWLREEAENYIFAERINYGDAVGIDRALREVIGTTGGIISKPFAYSNLRKEVVESRVNTTLLYSGDEDRESVYPQQSNWVNRPYPPSSPVEAGEVERGTSPYQFTKWWHEQFNNWDNYYNWNNQYSNVQDIKTSFPWNPNENIDLNNFNRVIRSASDSEDGRSESFRQFRENDFLDLPRNRGDITNLENLENTLMIHMDRALTYTRGREELRTQDFEVFLGSGDIFGVKPNEVLITDSGYAGLQNPLASINCKYGYFFVDQEDKRIIWFGQQGLRDLTTKQFGLHNYFREEFDFTNTIVGYDSNRERVIISSDNDTIVFNPDLQIWSTELSYSPDYMIRTLNNFYTQKNNIIYKHKEGESTIYGSPISFNIKYSIPHGFNAKLNHLWFNADYINSSGSITEDIPFNTISIENSHQNTGNINLTDYSTIDPTRQGNTRKSQGLWRVNNIRVSENNPNLPSWANERRLEDDYHIVTLSFINTNGGSIQLKGSSLEVNQTIK